MNQGLTGKESGLAAYWPFNEGSVDMSGNGHTAVFIDGAALVDSDVHLPQPIYPPDLSVSIFSVPSAATSANPPEITWQIQNTGMGNTAGSWVDHLYLSSDNVLDDGDTLLGEFPRSEVLAAESDYSQTQTLKIPDISPGSYYIILKTDSAGAVEETNKDDNIAVRPFTFAHAKLLTAAPDRIELNLIPGSSASGQINLGNIGEINISGISAVVQNAAENISINLETPPNLGSLASGSVQYAVTASDDSVLKNEAVVKFTSSNGGEASITFDITVIPARPKLVTNPGYLESGMLRGEQRIYEFELSNTGGASARNLAMLMPESSWLKLVTPVSIGTLGPGEKSKVQLMLSPPADMNLGPYSGDIVVSGTNTNLRIGFKFTAVSEAKGNLKITATDEFTYFADDHPNVADAEVIIKDAFSGTTIAEGVTDETGLFLLQNINEGRYSLEVRAEKHGTHHSTIEIVPGMTKDVEAFLQRQLVSYKWSVEPIEIEDSYSVNLEAVFETHVPAPVVTVEPNFNIVPLLKGETTTINVTITNHGLIEAKGVTFNFPQDTSVYIEPLFRDIGNLPPMTSVTVPVKIRAKEDGPIDGQQRRSSNRGLIREDSSGSNDTECLSGCVKFYYHCGDRKTNYVCVLFKIIKDVAQKWNTAIGFLNPINVGVAIAEQALKATGLDPEIATDIGALLNNIKDLSNSAMSCGKAAIGDASAILGCIGLPCKTVETYNSLCTLVNKYPPFFIEPIKPDPLGTCLCALVSAASAVDSAKSKNITLVGDATGAAKSMSECLCGMRFSPVFNEVTSGSWNLLIRPTVSGPGGFIELRDPCEKSPKK